MKPISEATKIMKDILGPIPSQYFSGQAEELMWYAKSLSMDPDKAGKPATPEYIKSKFAKISHNIISMSVKFFISEKYGDADEIIITDNSKVLDKNMKPINEISLIRNKQVEITAILVDAAMAEFDKGRKLAQQIIERVNAHVAQANTPPVQEIRNYFSSPPVESLEVEIMRLERRMAMLTHAEGRRLSELYDRVRAQKELDEELASWE